MNKNNSDTIEHSNCKSAVTVNQLRGTKGQSVLNN